MPMGPMWSATVSYSAGAIVNVDGGWVCEAIQPNFNAPPLQNPAFWHCTLKGETTSPPPADQVLYLFGEFDQITTDEYTEVVTVDLAQVKGQTNNSQPLQFTYVNTGADNVSAKCVSWNRQDMQDLIDTNYIDTAPAGFGTIYGNTGCRFHRVMIKSSNAGSPGRATGGFYFTH